MSDQSDRADAVRLLIIACTDFMKELTALATTYKVYVEKQTAAIVIPKK